MTHIRRSARIRRQRRAECWVMTHPPGRGLCPTTPTAESTLWGSSPGTWFTRVDGRAPCACVCCVPGGDDRVGRVPRRSGPASGITVDRPSAGSEALAPTARRPAHRLLVRRASPTPVPARGDSRRRGRRRHLLRPERLERLPAPERDQRTPGREPGQPRPHPAADAHRPGRRRGPPTPRCARPFREADRPELRRDGGRERCRRRRRAGPSRAPGSTSTSRPSSTSTASPETSSTSSSAPTRVTPRRWRGSARRSSRRSSAPAWPPPQSTFPGSARPRAARTPISYRSRCARRGRRSAPSTRRRTSARSRRG